ncbi:MAG: DUF3575 domain-containing protein [Bacteroidaceae bacterium]|nr:DUF3575 domain-containing protein [Bacteroidaceae bacterium]
MSFKKHFIALILFVFAIVTASAQEVKTIIDVDFRLNVATIDSTYSDNAKQLQKIKDFIQELKEDTTISIKEVSFLGAASPEGSDQINRRLSKRRLSALENYVRNRIYIPDSIIHRNETHIFWDILKEYVKNGDISHKEEILAILDEESELVNYYQSDAHIDSRILKIRKLDNGKVWRDMNRLYFANMRNAEVVFVTQKPEPQPIIVPEPVVEPTVEEPDTVIVETPAIEGWDYRLHFKTNAIGLAAGISNAAIEFDFAKHWSVAVPIYYSAWNYAIETIKFRTLAVQPEVRYWFSENNDKFFLGAHFGFAQYNIAIDGSYRYQDHNMDHPALGGGISVGYRLPLEASKRWNVEFTLGAGVYPLKYDVFHNTDDTKNGLLIGTEEMTYWGLDNAAITFSYALDFRKKKGGKQ